MKKIYGKYHKICRVLKFAKRELIKLSRKTESILFYACENVFNVFSQKVMAIRYIEEYIDKSMQIYVH